MLLHIEDLPNQGDRRPGRDCAHRVHGGRKAREVSPGEQAETVKEGQHCEHQQHADQRRDTVPMCRDKEKHTCAQQNGAEDESDQHLPPAIAGLGMSFFIGADGSSVRFIEQTGALPACQPDL